MPLFDGRVRIDLSAKGGDGGNGGHGGRGNKNDNNLKFLLPKLETLSPGVYQISLIFISVFSLS